MSNKEEINLKVTIDEYSGFGKEGTRIIISLNRAKTKYSLQISKDSIWLGREIDGHYNGLILTKKELYKLFRESYNNLKG